ncbi:MAG: hypothetical protein ACI832_002113 [Rheinheimera aquimaris]|jgi:hypothetical protein|uniref:flagellar hook-length control protein FliK n=3 Tax=Rheinheimera aquimaris TaxID=412437 RepID=UPI0039E71BED
MNQINLDKLLQLAPGAKADTAALKLVVAQVYQGQIQQLSSDGFRLQLPSAQGALQIDLPASASTSLQQLVLRSLPEQMQNLTTQQQLAHHAKLNKVPVQVQFQPQPDGQIKLSLQSSTAPVTLTLQPQQLRALLISLFSSQNAATLIKSSDSNSSAALVTAKLQTQGNNYLVQLPTLPALQLKTDAQSSLATALAGSHSNQLTVVLQLTSNDKALSTNLLLGAAQGQPPGVTLLDKPQQQALMRQLVQAFNQLQLSTANSQHPAMQILKPVIAARPDISGSYQLQLQPSAQTAQLQLLPQKAQLQLSVSPQDSNRPIQFVATGSGNPATSKAAADNSNLPLAVQQAWRNLLPLLSTRPDLLADLPELPEPVQQVLQLVRHSQPDGSKVLSASQLVTQLQSLLQFHPLQNQPNVQTSGGALAVAIQLLLGHLMQKPQNAALQPANQKLAQLINSLEPAQASSLLRQLASHSSTLQQSQLATLDSNQATQQHLLLQLPLQQGEQSVFSQIQLEQREADGKQQSGKETQWQLTMRFELQQLGALLVVAKLQQQQLQLQFYTEQQEAKQLADRFLPILKDRCTMQGLVVSEAECVLGKIPDTLLPRANSLLAIKV